MRLIDANGVKDSLLADLLMGVDGGTDDSYLKTYEVIDRIEKIVNEWVDKEPTVKAIPIEWMIKKRDEYSTKYGEVYYAVIYGLYNDWEKENEQKDNDRLILKAWKKTTLTKEELEKAFEDNEFNEYMQMLINKEFEKRLKQKVQGYESRDTESIK